MGGEWLNISLGEVTDNYDFKRIPIKKSDRRPGPYPYYGSSGIVDFVEDYIFDGEYVLISEDGVISKSSNVPIVCLTSGKFWVNNHTHIVRGNSLSDTRFLYYLMKRTDVGGYLTGTIMPKLTQGNMNKIRLRIPPLGKQRAIAHILGTLDDKIELNRRMNETLEAMARALFKSWFVDFDPVRAKMEGRDTGLPPQLADLFPDRLVPSELGEIPEGWEVGSVGDYFHLTMGQSPPGKTYNDIGNGLPFFQGRTDFGFRYPKNRKYCTAPKRLAQPEDTLVSVRAPVGDINKAWETSCIGRGIAALRHCSGSSSYTYYVAMELQKEIEQYEHTGTVFGSINKNQFANLQVIEPSEELVNALDENISPLDERIRENIAESLTLADIRDALLPKLISGELRVKAG